MKKKYNSYVVVGLQFGNEGKSKIISRISKDADYIIRATGGNNAGNIVELGDEKVVLNTLPVGILNSNSKCILGAGTFIEIDDLFDEIYTLEKDERVSTNVYIDYRTNIIMPYHTLIDIAKERKLGKNIIKSSKKGISSAYSDKVCKLGIRFLDLLDMEKFSNKLSLILRDKNDILEKYGEYPLEFNNILEKFEEYADKLKYRIVDTTTEINKALDENKKVIFESSQSTMLDIDYGTYPDVSSTNTTVSSICNGAGISIKKIENIIGVVKAYTTRLSEGLFPTEVSFEIKDHLVTRGNEYVSTTNIPRRCGWLDLAILKYSIMLNGVDSIALTKLDVLSKLEKIQLAVAYEIDKIVYQDFPLLVSDKKEFDIIYKEFDGWQEDISDIKEYDKLPENCKIYIEYIEGYLGVKISLISVGSKEHQVIIR